MTKRKVHLSLWQRDYDFLVRFSELLGYGSGIAGERKKTGMSRTITAIVRDSMTQTRHFSHETEMLLMDGSKRCCKGNVEEFVKLASKEWIEKN